MVSLAQVIRNPEYINEEESSPLKLVWLTNPSEITSIVTHIVSKTWRPSKFEYNEGGQSDGQLKRDEPGLYFRYRVMDTPQQFGSTNIVGFSTGEGREFLLSTPLRVMRSCLFSKLETEFIYIWSIPFHLAESLTIKSVHSDTHSLVKQYYEYTRTELFSLRQAALYPKPTSSAGAASSDKDTDESINVFDKFVVGDLGVQPFALKIEDDYISFDRAEAAGKRAVTTNSYNLYDIIGNKKAVYWCSEIENIKTAESRNISGASQILGIKTICAKMAGSAEALIFFRKLKGKAGRL